MNEKLNMNGQFVLTDQKADCTLGYIKRIVASRSRDERQDSPPPLCSCEIPPGALCSAGGPPKYEGHGPYESSSEEGHEDYERARAPLLCRQAERAGVMLPVEGKAMRRP